MLRIILQEYKNLYNRSSFIRALFLYFTNYDFQITCKIRRLLSLNSGFRKMLHINQLERKHGVKLGYNVKIGKNLIICHHNGIVIGEKVEIGDNCRIYHQVTLGQKDNKYPVVKDNVTLFPGCKIIGNITIGNNSIVAPNSVVIKDIPDNAVVSGIPAVIIGWRNNISE